MVRDKNATLEKTCAICRCRVVSKLHINSTKPNGSVTHWKVLCAESFSMLFGLPKGHPFVSLFVNTKGVSRTQLCSGCNADVADIHHIFWQLQNLESRLQHIQNVLLGRLRWNYEAIPVATVFAQLGEEDVSNNLENLNYDEVVKILFEKIKDGKKWPKPVYIPRWKQAVENAEALSKFGLKRKANLPDCENKENKDTIKVKTEVNWTNLPTVSLEDHDYRIASPPAQSPEENIKQEVVDDRDEVITAETNEDENKGTVTKRKLRLRPRPVRRKIKIVRKGRLLKPKPKNPATVVSSDKRFLCVEDPDNCSRTYCNNKHLRSHIKSFHKERKFICDHEGCTARFPSEDRLQKHRERLHEKKKIMEICDTCGAEVPRGDLKKHFYLRHLGVGKYSCEKCSMDFNESDDLKKHELLHEQAAYPFICVVCETLFTNSLDLKTHVSGNHRLSGIKCSVCGIMKANDYLLQRHMKVHNRANRFMCECGKSFASKGYLQYHQEHHHNNSGRKFPCSVCGKAFSHQKNTLRHMVTHSEDKPFQCGICHKKFNYSHLLKKHEEIHSGTKNYGCEVCGKRFRQEQNLRQHMRSHRPKPEKPMKHNADAESGLPELEEASIPVILDVKSDIRAIQAVKHENEIDSTMQTNIVTLLPVSLPQASIVHTTDGLQSGQSYISLQQPPPHGTTTVVFVTDPQSIQWIQE